MTELLMLLGPLYDGVIDVTRSSVWPTRHTHELVSPPYEIATAA